MTILLDTSLLIAGYDPGTEPVTISIISVGELRLGILAATDARISRARHQRLKAILRAAVDVLDVTDSVTDQYATIRHQTGRAPSNDLWIAATAAANRIALITADANQARLPIDVQYVRR
ncbi:MAG: PIN domain-containing protein [Actinomycetota bacterium]|nr:PIN domain-containing protein [Actinomycetota bacterium]